jgi:hypothetical protein
MCLLFEIGLLVFGIVTIALGRFTLTKTSVVRGAPARIIGVMMILPLPLTFLVALPILVVLLSRGAETGTVRVLGFVVQVGVLLVCFALGLLVALGNAQPVDKPQDRPDGEDRRARRESPDDRLRE